MTAGTFCVPTANTPPNLAWTFPSARQPSHTKLWKALLRACYFFFFSTSGFSFSPIVTFFTSQSVSCLSALPRTISPTAMA
jgi:hypothetical protein